jgi:magnesium-transporting ATPase (P-type)
MKKIIIGTLVGTVIFFSMQTIMWVGGLHNDFRTYTPNQAPIMDALNQNLSADGLYMLPMIDPADPDNKAKEEKLWNEMEGKPWTMIFYHKSQDTMNMSYVLIGLLYTLIACLIAAAVLFYGSFQTFNARFLVAMAFSVFTLTQGVLDDMNWWSYPWNFVKHEVMDLTIGWGICAVWLAWYFRK